MGLQQDSKIHPDLNRTFLFIFFFFALVTVMGVEAFGLSIGGLSARKQNDKVCKASLVLLVRWLHEVYISL